MTEVALDRALTLLREGEIAIEGRLIDASNATLYAAVTHDDLTAACVYKPIRGERPLWDFPDGTLAFREVAAYAVSAATGWEVVPPTVLREGPLGEGMVQLWIDVDPEVYAGDLLRTDHPALRRMAVFDAVVNNADRKGGHLLPIPGGHVYGVDHGVCFHAEPKLRTVLWGWRGRRFTDDELAVLDAVRVEIESGELGETLRALLAEDEVDATLRRVERLISTRRFPHPSPDWPAVPWPPF
jgi:uncharacterized repeat protein (TIGR03843 family)